ncbi:similar to Saccharomyces cerevisiae YLR106C MDN1 Huge dynein-related AAA-type ATPase (midasin), forms extended pre-60S particle with the Rix1 complex (Rix1p-Ipi1p-Ipi3p) [Maudiozyma barnettii]|uniref:Midasin n=1 Tax=Maudiozyma barnettii TaxID=61262 RepID=A0A8H2VHC5_9SACH|nr:AAA family ATPase midasin [Kazachstania barnettii]CAB4255465.1 similar to Saccharomyces cerevisiae YLR106C MDN1 Huge dynein-related AAA-type ATPase (midasin), forms extended pre-60S particle with the Rix1 complex (Rix1p-Ipi1p-Ipi3p) [Kazachstania barnettii]CAD1783933.1 similar to Saccharomyces cerevisiae YLR106C MDN1 Huge dynein-related AAA-type ATPase (midasin), forms extended pre-60S particle with the Rix1 complex (Rix1p-Ipi1p-Ipi3p) [Kazachstania barnettii]
MTSPDYVFLDLQKVKERRTLFTEIFPEEQNIELFKFNKASSTKENLLKLSKEILISNSIPAFLFIYKPIFLEILSQWIWNIPKEYAVHILDAAASIITTYPLSMSLMEEFLESENEHFTTILQNPSTQSEQDISKILLSYYRLLYHNKEVFSKYINPDLLYNFINSETNSFSNSIIKFLAIKIVSLYLDMGEQATVDMIRIKCPSQDELLGQYDNDSEIDYYFLDVNEAKRFSNYSRLPEVEECLVPVRNGKYFIIKPDDLTDKVVSICGILVPRLTQNDLSSDASPSFVPTEKTIDTFRQLAKQVQKSAPVMLIGKAGAGKTFIINELSKYMGCEKSIVKIHLGEQTDAKLLIGTYTSGDKPGTFEWRSGVLTTAVKEGRWVLIEDIDKAPTEVLSILLSLLEKRELTIPSRGETIKAANGFQLISTVRINNEDNRNISEGNDFNLNLIGMRIWNTVFMDEINPDDLNKILCNRFPVLSQLVPRLIVTYDSVKKIYENPKFISLNRGAHARGTSTRDLVKLCQRLEVLFNSNNITKPDQLIESSIYDNIFSEAVDCFASSIGELKALEPIIHTIGESLEIASSRISLFLGKHIPGFEDFDDHICIGRTQLEKSKSALMKKSVNSTSFAMTNHSLRLMEQIAVSVRMTEPVLLVGETGTGKTTVVQQLSKRLNKTLTVINVSQQTETGDLLGGYKPVNSKSIAVPVQETFEILFESTFSLKKNLKFHKMLHKCFNKSQWKNVVRLWNEAFKMAVSILKPAVTNTDKEEPVKKKKKSLDSHEKTVLLQQWNDFKVEVEKFEAQSSSIESSFVFDFIEGSLVKAVRNGEWLLLDEINLASADTLESISDLLAEATSRSILLSEKGDIEPVHAHPDFRLFACMNPATDVGKRDLPSGIRSKFTEIYVHSPDNDIRDLLSIIDKYIGKYSSSDEWIGNDIAELYLEAKKLSENNRVVDGSNQKPHFSIRTLTRTLLYVRDIIHIYGLRRSLYDGFCMSFLTLLDQKSAKILEPIIEKHLLGRVKNVKSILRKVPPAPGSDYIKFNYYWMKKGNEEIKEQAHYIITPFVEKNMMNLVRATSSRRFPILVQGPTSSGKTSMIKYLADITGHKFVRINNHEHTDLQEYLGTYIADDSGKLAFREGVLVEALRNGYWIVLDELNLAPTDVLEALNRLLDDNRELFIPETQEVIHPHPDFMLFATQNPPGVYGGRKVLSRAFRNRFLELHFDDIPQDELEIILRERCRIAPSYAKKIVEVYRQLSIERSASRLFEQKNSFATLRDLFRWALREAVGYEQLAANGYMLLAERCRTPQEKVVIQNILMKVMKVKLDMNTYYESLENKSLENENTIVWTGAMRRLAVLVSTCLKNNEPILLVGETGCGKTTICQILASYLKKNLITLNAHQNTETGDILGAQRPVRNRSELQGKLLGQLQNVLNSDIDDIDQLLKLYNSFDKSTLSSETKDNISKLRDRLRILFEWSDGPLIHAMKTGNFFLLDEISLADDSVLERLNSVLEPERSILLAEKGVTDNFVTATEGFQFFATMNPGGDYGKKELSPALRNRFTEIWVPSMENFDDVNLIVSSRLLSGISNIASAITDFSEWFGKKFGGGNATNGIISLRDILAWVEFINSTHEEIQDPYLLLVQGAMMVFIDALGTNNTAYLAESEETLNQLKSHCLDALSKFAKKPLADYVKNVSDVNISNEILSVGPFSINRNSTIQETPSFNLSAPTTKMNLMRVIRALQVKKPILLEGSPGVGKTSLITALASITDNKLTRINLSEQTDLVDLFGSDTPGERSGEFVWRDAPFLRAMQKGEWVLLDEMNLASQSVLEGLNACLDHRGEAYIPELDRSFTRHPNFIVFAAQNPQYQGGGRKGLPKSFVNRFSVVYVDLLKTDDLTLIANYLYPTIEKETILGLINVMSTLEQDVSKDRKWATLGSPWEFNLRDALRWLKLLSKESISGEREVFDFVNTIVVQRFRTASDKENAQQLIESIFGTHKQPENFFRITREYIQMNNEVAVRNDVFCNPISQHLNALQCNIEIYETVLRCINRNWPLIMVGPTNSGKTDVIRYIAGIVGADLHVFSMNSDVDSMDILGGYEQVDLVRKISYITSDLKTVLRKLLCVNLRLGNENKSASIIGLKLLKYISSTTITVPMFADFKSKFKTLYSFIQNDTEFDNLDQRMNNLSEIIDKESAVKFEWFDGMLVRAVEQGHWLVLDNANLCSPSVLDRLNSLLETDGSLLINECSQANGEPRVLKPHRNFRLFITMNPKYGELSRAMRNRGIEIYIDDLKDRATLFDNEILLDSRTESANKGVHFKKEGDVTNDFNILSISNNSRPHPLIKFMPTYSADLSVFAVLDDIICSNQGKMNSDILTSVIPLDKVDEIKRWSRNVQHNHSFSTSIDHEIVADYIYFLENKNVLSRINRIQLEEDSKIGNILNLPEVIITPQYINPILNVFTLPILKKILPNVDSSESIYLFTCFAMLLTLSRQLQTADARSKNSKIDELNYLELSAAIFNGRHVRNGPQIPLFALLVNIINFVTKFLTEGSLFENSHAYKQFTKLLLLVESTIQSAQNKDEARLRVYQELLEKWSEEASSEGIEVEEFTSICSSVKESLSLTSGQSIVELWEAFRRVYPSTLVSWKLWDELCVLGTHFDKVKSEQFNESYESIRDLTKMISLISQEIINNDESVVKGLLMKFEDGIQGLEDISSKFLLRRKHFFKEEFDSLSRLLISRSDRNKDIIFEIAPFTTFTTEKLIKFDNDNYSYPPVFDYLWKSENGIYKSFTDSIFSSKYFENIVLKSNQFTSFAGSQIKQTIVDAKKLLSSTIRTSNLLLENSTEEYSKLLVCWMDQIVFTHTNSNLSIIDRDMWEQYVITESSEAFRETFKEFIQPAYLLSQRGISELGTAYVLFGIALIQLFTPNRPVDPAINDYVHYQLFSKHKEFSESMLNSWSTIRTVISGDEKIYAEDLSDVVTDDDAPKKPKVYRPTTPIDNLFDEWLNFVESNVSSEQANQLLTTIDNNEKYSSDRLELFQQNTSNFMKRLDTGYTYFSDLNEIFSGYIMSMKFGFDILRYSEIEKKKTLSLSALWPIDVLELYNTKKIKNSYGIVSKLINGWTLENTNNEKVLVFFLRLIKLHNMDDNLLPVFNEILQSLYYRWSLKRIREEQKQQEEASLFKYDDTEEDIETAIKKMFPDYEDVLDTDINSSKKSNEDFEEIHYTIAKLYISIFNADEQEIMKDMIEKGSSVVDIMIQESTKLQNNMLNGNQFVGVMTSLSDKIHMFESSDDNKSINFYEESSISESQRAVTLVTSLWLYVNTLLAQWPDHATLIELTRMCKEFLENPTDTPMAKQLHKIEQIYTVTIEWEKYAASKVSLNEYITKITSLIVSWRKSELRTWNELFNTENEKIRKSIGKWWFYLFETIIVSNTNENNETDSDKNLMGLTISLNTFFSKSTLGEYSDRLRLVSSFKKHAEILGLSPALSNALANIISFYEQFEDTLLQQLQKGKKLLEKDMNEVILLASWKDVNVDALKQSSRRSHNSLFKIVKKYRTILSTNVLSLIETGLPYAPNMALSLCHIQNTSSMYEGNDESTKQILLNIPGWNTRSKILQNTGVVSTNMEKYVSTVSAQTFPDFVEFVKDYAREADRLRDETPNVYKKEIKKLLATLKTQKSKLFSDALKELRRSGLKTSFRKDIHKIQGNSTIILASSVAFGNNNLKNSDTYYFRIIDILPRLRSAAASPADDVPIAGIEKGMAVIENLMFSLITTRRSIDKLSNNFEVVCDLHHTFESYCSSQGSINQSSLKIDLSNMQFLVSKLPMLLDYCINALLIVDETMSTEHDRIFLNSSKIKLSSFQERLKKVIVSDSLTSQMVSEFKNFMANFIKQINDNKTEFNFFIYDVLLNWINTNNRPHITEAKSSKSTDLSEIDQLLRKLYTSIILAFQKVMEDDCKPITTEDDLWLSTSSRRIVAISKLVHSDTIIKNIKKIEALLKTRDFSIADSQLIRAMLMFTMPVVTRYRQLIETAFKKTRSYYVNLSQGSYILSNILFNLAKNGFCSPEPPSEEVEDNNLHDGTGLGDGEGAQNNSNDVEEDEDLSENAQQDNQDQKDKDERDDDENDDAVEMEGDMAGQMEDLSDQEQNDEDQEMEEEDEELDEEIDNLDEDDPNAIDDKMWDEKPDDNSKEKNSDKTIDNADDNNDVQANEENDNESNENPENANEQEGQQDEQKSDETNEDNNKLENDSDANSDSEGEDVGEQDDEVKNEEGQNLDENVPEVETMDLPEDMNLDSGDENGEESEDENMKDEFPEEQDDDEDIDMENDKIEPEIQETEIDEAENSEEQEVEETMDTVDIDETPLPEGTNDNIDESESQEEAEEEEAVSDEEELNNEQGAPDENEKDQEEKQEQEEGSNNDIDGLNGIDMQSDEENINNDAAVNEQSGAKGTGSDSKDTEEQDDVGNFGTTQNSHEEQEDQKESTDASREEAKESLKQLGDALKEFHRRRQDINETSERDEDENEEKPKANERPDEFEHVEGANTESDTQALGSATQEQLQSINEDMAIDDELPENQHSDSEDNIKAEDEDHDMLQDELLKKEEENISDLEMNEGAQQQNDTDNELGQRIFTEKDDQNEQDDDMFNEKDLIESQQYKDELDELIDTIDNETKFENIEDTPKRSIEESRELWQKSERSTSDLVSRLGEQLRLILEPTLATKLKGDYKTGKRLNMKRIIPYIASQFRKDKIWLRRTKPSKREYQIMIALDNSKSMSESNCVKLAFESLCLVSRTLTQLESGGLSIVKFGESSKEVHSFDQQFSNETGAKVFQWFDFQDTKTDVKKLVAESLKIFENGRAITNSDQWQLEIIISDGVCEDHETIERLVRRAREKKIMLVFVIIDGISSNESIMDMSQVNYIPDKNGVPQLKITKYLDNFPFEFYVVVHEISELPEMLALILRQYFTDLASS